MNLSRLFALVLIFATLSVPVMAREERIRTPNAVESRAAYCLAVLRDQKNSGQSLRFLDPIGNPMAERMEQDNLRDNINRLQNFITPRLRLIDNGSMVTAQMQGKRIQGIYARLSWERIAPRCVRRMMLALKPVLIKAISTDVYPNAMISTSFHTRA